MRTTAALAALLAAAADAQLVANAPKQPHELNVTTDLCVGRTSRVHRCSVLLDVPTACATDSSSPTSACPIVLMLHDEGSTGHAFVPTSPSVHGAGVIAIYPTAVSAVQPLPLRLLSKLKAAAAQDDGWNGSTAVHPRGLLRSD